MISVDTNILVRFFTEDDPTQLKQVHKLFKAQDKKRGIFISLVVLLELHWVLDSCYQWSRDKFCDCMEDVLRCPQFALENPQVVKIAVSRYRKKEDFSDALIGQIAAVRNLKTYTFDRALSTDSAFVVLD